MVLIHSLRMKNKYISSKENPFVKYLHQLIRTPGSYQNCRKIVLEGEHLCDAYKTKKCDPIALIFSQSGFDNPNFTRFKENDEIPHYIMTDALFKSFSSLKSDTGIACLIEYTPENMDINPMQASIILDRLQDPGNLGTILRSASAFGFTQVIALKNTAALWSQKVLRAGMGAHFSLKIHEQCHLDDIKKLKIPLLGSSSHANQLLQQTKISMPCAWIIGHEGQGISDELMNTCNRLIKIEQPGGEESLNAAIACSICLYESTKHN